ncbi:hypothetical protein DSUL_40069 [Desulfovibrionales bacterium]
MPTIAGLVRTATFFNPAYKESWPAEVVNLKQVFSPSRSDMS